MTTIPEKPSLWRRLAQFLCPHNAWTGATVRDEEGRPLVTVRRCLTCAYQTWEEP